MNHHPQFHIDRLAHDHHGQLVSNAAARRVARTAEHDHGTRGERHAGRVVRPRTMASIVVAAAGLFAGAGGGTVDAGRLAAHVCEAPDMPSAELTFGRFLRAV